MSQEILNEDSKGKNYQATEEDLIAVEEALQYLWKPELDYIFADRATLLNTLVVSFDATRVYIWKQEAEDYKLYSFSHSFSFDGIKLSGWCCGAYIKGINEYIPQEWLDEPHQAPFISGVLLHHFIGSGKEKGKKYENYPYQTRESYLATLLHEFGHAYYNRKKTVGFRNRTYNVKVMEASQKIFSGELLDSDLDQFTLSFPINRNLTEIFAFCVEYAAAELFFQNHKRELDKFYAKRAERLLAIEYTRNPYWELSPLEFPHDCAAVFGSLVMKKFGNDWTNALLFF